MAEGSENSTERLKRKGKKVLAWTLGSMGLLALLCASRVTCLSSWALYGVRIPECPSGDLRQTAELEASSLRRNSVGYVTLRASAHYTTGQADQDQSAYVHRLDGELSLVDASGKVTPLEPEDGWDEDGVTLSAQIKLPEVPDGDYTLRGIVSTPIGESTVEAPLPIYAPARVHVITDRPLYEPGNSMAFRAVVLRAADLAPLDGRPGKWIVKDPSGEVLLEEKAPAGEWGVVSGSFPIDREATSGPWTVSWVSGDASADAVVTVEPFTLPRFRVEVTPNQGWYRPGDRPVVTGRVVYSSGAPVAGAAVELNWSVSGDWPPPTDWLEGALPKDAVTDNDGRFVLTLPQIPADLQGRSTLSASVAATDPAGDRVGGGLSLLLSEDPLQVTAVTELGDGLVEGFNNRMYLRATTPTGDPLVGTTLRLRPSYDPTAKPREAKTDEDGVAAFQVDPGPAINVVIPAKPYRPPAREPGVSRSNTQALLGNGEDELPLADQLALDRLVGGLQDCARFVSGSENAHVALVIEASGAIRDAVALGRPGECLAAGLRGRSLSATGTTRVYSVDYSITDQDLPKVSYSQDEATGSNEALTELLNLAVLDARSCLPADLSDTDLGQALLWRVRAGSTVIEPSWASNGEGTALRPDTVACLKERLTPRRLPEPADEDALAVVTFAVSPSPRASAERPQPTTLLGYSFRVSAGEGDEKIGETTLVQRPGTVPNLRIRATPVLAKAGDAVEIELLRGPDFNSELPEKLQMTSPKFKALEVELDKETRKTTFTLPPDAEGWFQVSVMGALARVFVAPKSQLQLELSSDKRVYAPGETATLGLLTTEGGQGVQAAVTLIGVDQSLGQLAPLPGADHMGGLRPKVTTNQAAFDILDGEALSLGRVRGANAAAAVVLRVSDVPQPEDLDRYTSASGRGRFDAVADLTDHFYTVLGELHNAVRAWEKAAGKDEKMKPEKMAELWETALEAAAGKKQPVTDAYGRRIRLSQLPPDLLALTDPRAVVIDGTHLPEDIENWSAWVAREQP